jgi:uncharacterized protein YjbJ (UPF0337 family)
MNEDILKGTCLEIKGRVKEKWGKLAGSDAVRIEGKGDKLFGLLRKKYGYIRDKAEAEYKDSVELAEIVSSISKVMTMKNTVTAVAFIARYGRPLLSQKQESQPTGKDKKHEYNTDRYFDSRLSRRNTYMALQ